MKPCFASTKEVKHGFSPQKARKPQMQTLLLVFTPTMLSEEGTTSCLDSVECEEWEVLAQDFSYPYHFHKEKYYLSDAEAEAAIAKRTDAGLYDSDSFFENSDPQQYPIMEIMTADGGSPVEYGDVDGDGYTDAVVTLRYDLGLYGLNDVSFIPLAWRMNPVTGIPEQISPALFARNRCSEEYDFTEFGVPKENFITVHYLDFDPENICCGCERTVPKEFVLEFDPESRTFLRP